MPTALTIAYANFFRSWIDNGGRIDIVFNLHNVESKEGMHLTLAQVETSRADSSKELNLFLIDTAEKAGFEITRKERPLGTSPTRLSGWLASHYGALPMPYEVNSQERTRHLTVAQMQGLGEFLVTKTGAYLNRLESQHLGEYVADVLRRRKYLSDKYGKVAANAKNAFEYESILEFTEKSELLQAAK